MPLSDILIYYEDSLPAREIQRYRKSHSVSPFGIDTDIVFVFRYPEEPRVVGIPKYRSSFGIPSSGHGPVPVIPPGLLFTSLHRTGSNFVTSSSRLGSVQQESEKEKLRVEF